LPSGFNHTASDFAAICYQYFIEHGESVPLSTCGLAANGWH